MTRLTSRTRGAGMARTGTDSMRSALALGLAALLSSCSDGSSGPPVAVDHGTVDVARADGGAGAPDRGADSHGASDREPPLQGDGGTGCPKGFALCGGTCVDPLSNLTFCGASGDCQGSNAGAACASGEVCSAGTCDLTCQSGLVECGGTCVDPQTSLAHCGASGSCAGSSAGTACKSGEICSAGACTLSCQSGLVACGGVCTDPQSSSAYCGASGSCAGSSAGTACKSGEVCKSGTCTLTCPSGLVVCGGTCIDPSSNPSYCGASGSCTGSGAGKKCPLTSACVASQCKSLLMQWGTTTALESSSYDATGPEAASSSTGNGVVVWRSYDGAHYQVAANRYFFSSGTWSGAAILSTGLYNAFSPGVAIDASGNIHVVWEQNSSVLASRYSASSGTWGTAAVIASGASYPCSSPRVAVDGSGNAVAVWLKSDGTAHHVYASRYSASGGAWGAETSIEKSSLDSGAPQLAVDPSGDAVAVWRQQLFSSVTEYRVVANRYSASSGAWGTAAQVSDTSIHSDCFTAIRVAIDASGNAIAVWTERDSSSSVQSVYASRCPASSGAWGTPALLESSATTASEPRVAVDADGDAVAVWLQSSGSTSHVAANRYSASSGAWGTAALIESSSADASSPRLASDTDGNVMAVWVEGSLLAYTLYASRYSPLSGSWGTPISLDNTSLAAPSPTVAIDGYGYPLAAWDKLDSSSSTTRSIYADVYE
jgi:hypothetical protein